MERSCERMYEYKSQYRYDILQKRWVIIASERGKRPDDFVLPKGEQEDGFCPFCPGNEEKTPREILSVPNPGAPSSGSAWRVRVVPTKYHMLAAALR